MKMIRKKHGKRAALLGSLLTFLLVPAAFAAETMPIDLATAISRSYATHADIRKAEYSWTKPGQTITPPVKASGRP